MQLPAEAFVSVSPRLGYLTSHAIVHFFWILWRRLWKVAVGVIILSSFAGVLCALLVPGASSSFMPGSRPPYRGPKRRLVLAFDLGTTYSGASYVLLDPGKSPVIHSVTR
jgi:hypothetical protein